MTQPNPDRSEADAIEADDWTARASMETSLRDIARDLAAGMVAIERARSSATMLLTMLRHQRKSAVRAQRSSRRTAAAVNLWDKF